MSQNTEDIDIQVIAINIVKFLRSNFWGILISSIIGMASIGGVSYLLPEVYVSNVILSSDILTEAYTNRIAESIDNLINENNHKEIARKLSLTETQAKKIKKIDIESITPKNTGEDEKEAIIFIITVDVVDQGILDSLQEGIINFLRNNEYVKIRVKQREFLNSEMVKKTDAELRSLDSLKRKLFLGQPIYSKSAEMMLVDPSKIYEQIIDITKQNIEFRNSLELKNSIQLVEGFTTYKRPAKPSHFVLGFIGFFMGFFLYLAIHALQWLIKKARAI